VPLGIFAAASAIVGWLFGWPVATVITMAVPCLAILGLGDGRMRREPEQEAFARSAFRLLLVAAVWLPIELLIDTLGAYHGPFYSLTNFLVDARFYIGWAIGLALVPSPVDAVTRAGRVAP